MKVKCKLIIFLIMFVNNVLFGVCVYLVKGGNMNYMFLLGLKYYDWVFNIFLNKNFVVVSDFSKYLFIFII